MKEKGSFDSAAEEYDAVFTNSHIGKLQRKRVYHWLDRLGLFNGSKKIFEINCGTGFDADYFSQNGHEIVATDASEEMIQVAIRSRSNKIKFYKLSFDHLTTDDNFKQSNVLFSNFGGLNCMDSNRLSHLLNDIGKVQNSGDHLVFVLMPKYCLMEDLYFFFRFQWNKIGRRNSNKALEVNVNESIVDTYYHSPYTLKNGLKDIYDVLLIKPSSIFLPPSYMEPFFKRRLIILSFLNRLESFFGRFSSLSAYADHYVLIAKRK